MVKQMTFTIDENGEVTLSVNGVTGQSCEDFSRPFEKSLGIVTHRKLKDSYFTEVESDTTNEVSNDVDNQMHT
jgi:hypothetical protein